MNTAKAARNTLVLWRKGGFEPPQPDRDPHGISLAHAHWLLLQVLGDEVTGEKAHRWLAWAQALVTAEGQLTLNDCKYANVLS